MRTLVHYGVLHDVPFRCLPRKRKGQKNVQEYPRMLEDWYLRFTIGLLEQQEKAPFQRVYLDGYVSEEVKISRSEVAFYIPVQALMSFGVELMKTEHDALLWLNLLLRKDFYLYANTLQHIPLEEAVEALAGKKTKLQTLLRDFFRGMKYANIHEAREYWIGRNIASTL